MFDHRAIEKKWQERWQSENIYRTEDAVPGKENEYLLVEYPYPSGNLHIGHWYAFAVPDIYARFRRMQGKNVLFPMGFDSFGLPAENAAIKRGLDPRAWTYDNIAHMTRQLESMGNSFDWSRKVVASDPEYYRFTQWLFLKLYEAGLAYKKSGPVPWCDSCKTVLANEQIVNGGCERCSTAVVQKELSQWYLKITDYAERLLSDLETLDWPEEIKAAQREWIGRSEGSLLQFKVQSSKGKGAGQSSNVEVFTTRADTLFGATYLVLAPEHPLLRQDYEGQVLWQYIDNKDEVSAYIDATKKKKELERKEGKEKTGVELKGVKAIHPATKEEIPIWIADYVLGSYGTGAIMAVPAHDERDNEFAKKYRLPIAVVIKSPEDYKNVDQAELERTAHEIFESAKRLGFKAVLVGGAARSLKKGGHFGLHSDLDVFVDTVGFDYLHAHFTGRGLQSATREGQSDVHQWNNHRWYWGNGVWIDLFLLEQDGGEYFDTVGTARNNWGNGQVFEEIDLGGTKITVPTEDVLGGIDFTLSHAWNRCYTDHGVLTRSGEFIGVDSETAKSKITEHVGGTLTTQYRLRDWLLSRQRYWGCPIPVVYDPEGKPHAVPEEHLPWTLPTDVDFKPTGEAPLAKSKELRERTERIFGTGWTPEVDTMDTFVDSSWYFLRYLDPTNEREFCSLEKQRAWMPVALYSGGAEHTTMHLLYSRFFYKALFDLGLVTENEPYTRRMNRGLILGPDGAKMSKSKGNVIDPDENVERVGADTVKMYLAFIGPYNEPGQYPWDLGGIAGVRRFLERTWRLRDMVHSEGGTPERGANPTTSTPQQETLLLVHQTIKKVTEGVQALKFNTAISALMILVNHLEKCGAVSAFAYETLIRLLAPFAPHLTEEIWEGWGHRTSVHRELWPVHDESVLAQAQATVAVQIDGKTRTTFKAARDLTNAELVRLARAAPGIAERLAGKVIVREVVVPNRLVGFVTAPTPSAPG